MHRICRIPPIFHLLNFFQNWLRQQMLNASESDLGYGLYLDTDFRPPKINYPYRHFIRLNLIND